MVDKPTFLTPERCAWIKEQMSHFPQAHLVDELFDEIDRLNTLNHGEKTISEMEVLESIKSVIPITDIIQIIGPAIVVFPSESALSSSRSTLTLLRKIALAILHSKEEIDRLNKRIFELENLGRLDI